MTEPVSKSAFPDGFLWGAATAAYQIEGAAAADGRGESIWDRFTHTPGKTADGHTGDHACNSYYQYRDDIDLLKQIDLNAYRFSIAWSRVLPSGSGRVNAAGLDYYDRLVDGLLAAGITPFITLYHWDLPQALQDQGGWDNRETVYRFSDYAALVVQRLGDRVQHWITHNEPWCVSFLGHYLGIFAPGIRDLSTAVRVSHHLLLSHGLAIPAMRASARNSILIGIAPNSEPTQPASQRPQDIAAAARYDGFFTRWFLDPLTGSGYPQDMLAYYEGLGAAPAVQAGDMEAVATPVDFIGINYYNRYVAADFPEGGVPQTRQVVSRAQPRTGDREIYPEGLSETLIRLHRDYGFKAIYVSENGAAYPDRLHNGTVQDFYRILYLQEHFAQAAHALQNGVPLRGYFVWTLMDNFEWAAGFTMRYGLAHTHTTESNQVARILKDSGKWLSAFLQPDSDQSA